MARQSKVRASSGPEAAECQHDGEPLALAERRALHGRTVPSVVYGVAVGPIVGSAREFEASEHARDVIDRMAPRDPAEEMLVAQMLFAHARAMHLSQLATRQTDAEAVRIANEYADRASNTYRKLLLALAEYRRPARSIEALTVVAQANIAGEQVVQNHAQIATNELGSAPPRDARRSRAAVEAAVSALVDGIGFAPSGNPGE